MKIIQISSKRTRALAKQILGDTYEEGLWNNLLALDLTPTEKHLPVLAKFIKEGVPFSSIVKVYRLFENSKLRNIDLYKYKRFSDFQLEVQQHKSKLSQYYDALSRVDKTTSNLHVSTLLRLMGSGDLNLAQISYYYEMFMESDLTEEKDFNTYANFNELEQDVDALGGVVLDDLADESVPPFFENGEISVYLGDSKRACTDLSKGYTFCIGRDEAAYNMYASYRLKGKTFYFVRFHKREANNNPYIVIHANRDGSLSWTNSSNTGDNATDKEYLLRNFPELKALFDKNILVNIPLKADEREMLSLVRNPLNDIDFKNLTYENKTNYVEYGHDLSPDQMKLLDGDQMNIFVNILIANDRWLSDNQFYVLKPSLRKRYKNQKLERVVKNAGLGAKVARSELFLLDDTEVAKTYYDHRLKGNLDVEEYEKEFVIRNGFYENYLNSIDNTLMRLIEGKGRLRKSVLSVIKGTKFEDQYIRDVLTEKYMSNVVSTLFESEVEFIKGTYGHKYFLEQVLPKKMQLGIPLQDNELSLLDGTRQKELYVKNVIAKSIHDVIMYKEIMAEGEENIEQPVYNRLTDAALDLIKGSKLEADFYQRSLETGWLSEYEDIQKFKELDEEFGTDIIEALIKVQLVHDTFQLSPEHLELIEGTPYIDQYWANVDNRIEGQVKGSHILSLEFDRKRLRTNAERFSPIIMKRVNNNLSQGYFNTANYQAYERDMLKEHKKDFLPIIIKGLEGMVLEPDVVMSDRISNLRRIYTNGELENALKEIYIEKSPEINAEIARNFVDSPKSDTYMGNKSPNGFISGFASLDKILSNMRKFTPNPIVHTNPDHYMNSVNENKAASDNYMKDFIDNNSDVILKSLLTHINECDPYDWLRSAGFIRNLSDAHPKIINDPRIATAVTERIRKTLLESREVDYTASIERAKMIDEAFGLDIIDHELKNESYKIARDYVERQLPMNDYSDYKVDEINQFYNGRIGKDLAEIKQNTFAKAFDQMKHLISDTDFNQGFGEIFLSLYKRYRDFLEENPDFDALMERNQEKWLSLLENLFIRNKMDLVEDFGSTISFFKKRSGLIYTRFEEKMEESSFYDNTMGREIREEKLRQIESIFGYTNDQESMLDFFLSGGYNYEYIDNIKEVLSDPAARYKAMNHYTPAMLQAFHMGNLDYIDEMNSLIHFSENQQFLDEAYTNAKRWIMRMFRHLDGGRFVEKNKIITISENDMDQFSYLNDFFKGAFANDDDIYQLVRTHAVRYLSMGMTGTLDLLNEELNGRLQGDYDNILFEASSGAKSWAIKYMSEGNTEALEDLIEIFGEVILNDPVIQQNMEANAGQWYTFYKASIKDIALV